MAQTRPLAIGLLGSVNRFDARERRRIHLRLFLTAEAEGYALVETFEIGESSIRADSAFHAVEILAEQIEAAAVVYTGAVDGQRLEALAQSSGVTLLHATAATDTCC